MGINVSFSPLAFDFGFVPPGSDGPDISVDPSFGPPAISFAGGVEVDDAPVGDLLSARIEDDATGVYRLRDLTVMALTLETVDTGELHKGHHGPPPKVEVLEIVTQSQGDKPVAIKKGQFLLVRAAYRAPEAGGPPRDFKATLVITGSVWEPIRVPLVFHLGLVTASLAGTLTIVQGGQATVPVTMQSIAGPRTEVVFELSLLFDTGLSLLPPNRFLLNPDEALSANLTFHAASDAPLGPRTVFVERLAFRQRLGMILPTNILAPAAPPPDPRVDPFDVVHVPESTHRVCQLTGRGDPEGKPHLNDTTRFALLGTDLGISFDHVQNDERRTYFFFGDTQTSAGDSDGDAIAFTTDVDPEPAGLHLQFIMGDRQWRRLVIPGVSLENFEVPSGGFSHAGRLFIFATTDALQLEGSGKLPQRSVLASAADAHDNFEPHFFVSSRNDTMDKPDEGGQFINIAAWKIASGLAGLPDNATTSGEGLLMVGTGRYRESKPYLAYMPLPAGGIPQQSDLRYLKGFKPFEPGFGPSGPPDWGNSEADRQELFVDQIGELSFVFNADLDRWLLVYNGSTEGKRGVLLRSAPRPWGPWSPAPQLIFEAVRDGAQGKYMFECAPYGPYVISRYNRFDSSGIATIYYTLSNGECRQGGDFAEPHYQVHLMKSSLRLVSR
jgi:hypothetical protein